MTEQEVTSVRAVAAQELGCEIDQLEYVRCWLSGIIYSDGTQDEIFEYRHDNKTARVILYANDIDPRPYGWPKVIE